MDLDLFRNHINNIIYYYIMPRTKVIGKKKNSDETDKKVIRGMIGTGNAQALPSYEVTDNVLLPNLAPKDTWAPRPGSPIGN